MAEKKKADYILQDLEADEVSLVPKAANTHKFLILKAEEEDVEKAERPTKADGGKNYFASDYAYVPDPQKPSTWKLRLTNTPGGVPDAGIVGAAIAALGKGFRGQKVQIPTADLGKVKAKVRAAWKKANPDRSAEEMPDVISKSTEEEFDAEILKAELEEALETAFDGEGGLQDLVEKGALSPRAMSAVKGAVRLLRGFERELPSDFMDMIRGLMGASQESAKAGKKSTSHGGPLAKSDEQEDEEMADDVKKTAEEDAQKAAAESKPETTANADEVLKAKKAEHEEEEEEMDDEKSKKPPFMKGKGKKEAAKKADDGDFLATLPEDARTRVEAIFKAHQDLEAQAAEIRKAQEETTRELAAERDARKLEQAVQKAATEYPNLPVDSKVVGAMVKKAEEVFTKEQADEFKRVLKAADNAIAESKAFTESNNGTHVFGDSGSALSRLKEIAKGLVAKSGDKPMTEAMAFAKAAEQNPGLYDEYQAEHRG